jgi:hypothetical protein
VYNDRAFHLLALCAITRISLQVDDMADDALRDIRTAANEAREFVNRSHGQHARYMKRLSIGGLDGGTQAR